jgi:hypothetical protein
MPLFEAYAAGARAMLVALLSRLAAWHRHIVVVHDRINAYARRSRGGPTVRRSGCTAWRRRR